jgi:hypothetical protein
MSVAHVFYFAYVFYGLPRSRRRTVGRKYVGFRSQY